MTSESNVNIEGRYRSAPRGAREIVIRIPCVSHRNGVGFAMLNQIAMLTVSSTVNAVLVASTDAANASRPDGVAVWRRARVQVGHLDRDRAM